MFKIRLKRTDLNDSIWKKLKRMKATSWQEKQPTGLSVMGAWDCWCLLMAVAFRILNPKPHLINEIFLKCYSCPSLPRDPWILKPHRAPSPTHTVLFSYTFVHHCMPFPHELHLYHTLWPQIFEVWLCNSKTSTISLYFFRISQALTMDLTELSILFFSYCNENAHLFP